MPNTEYNSDMIEATLAKYQIGYYWYEGKACRLYSEHVVIAIGKKEDGTKLLYLYVDKSRIPFVKKLFADATNIDIRPYQPVFPLNDSSATN